MATYAFRDAHGDLVLNGPHFAKPTPVHALTPAADAAHAAVAKLGAQRRIRNELARLVAPGRPHVEPYDLPVASAVRLAETAAASGWRTNTLRGVDRVTLEGIRGDEAFRMTWVRGRAATGSWHERQTRYAMTHDARPIGVSKLTRTSLAGKRAAGVGEYHLSIVATPRGVPCSVTEIEKRIRA